MDDVTLNKQAAGIPTEKEEEIVPTDVTPEAVTTAQAAPPTPEEQKKMRLMIFAAYADAARTKLAHNRGLLKQGKPTEKLIALGASKTAREGGYGIAFDETEHVKPEDLRKFVPLPGDDMVYAIDKSTKLPILALDKYGFISFPKQKANPIVGISTRLKPHISKKENAIKALALQVFPVFFAEHGGKLLLEAKATAAKEGKDFDDTAFGIPESDMAALYKKSMLTGTLMYNRNAKSTRRQRRRQQQLSRHINAHQLPSGSVPSHTYFIFGVPGGAGKPCRAVVIRKAQEVAAAKVKEAASAEVK